MTAVARSTVPRRRLGIRVRRISGELHVAVRDSTVILSEAGALLLVAIDGTRSVDDLAALLAAEYGIPQDEALADTGDFVAECREGGILEPDG